MEQLIAGEPLGASYTLVEPVGKGASGQVWLLKHAKKSEPLVAKILYRHLAQDPSVVERFVRERSVLLGLEHEHIVTVHDLVVEGSTLALVMDYFPGGSLREVLNKHATLAPAQALLLCATVLETLAYAHGLNVIHRDIKPDNILFSAAPAAGESLEKFVKVTDFGISSIINTEKSNTTGIVGTPYYIPPELIQTGISGPAGDVYSTGIMLYELLCGRTPFAGEGTDFTIAYRHLSAEVPTLELPEPIWQTILSLLDKNPRSRPHPLDAAAQLRKLALRFDQLPALPAMANPQSFTPENQAQTVIRGLSHDTQSFEEDSIVDSQAPLLGEASNATIIKPQHVNRVAQRPEISLSSAALEPAKQKRKTILFSVLGLVLLVGIGWGIFGVVSSESAPKDPFSAEGQQESVLPTGLSVRREATYNPSSSSIDLTVTYSAQKTALSGDLIEVLPATEGGSCPNASWEGVSADRNQPTITGMNVECGWHLKKIEIGSNQQVQLQASIATEVQDQKQLEKWLDDVSSKTQDAIGSKEFKSSAYPLQRLQDISVKVPARTVSQSVLPITLLPVWPSGEDALNPLYSSETVGKPSGMLQAIAGEGSAVNFSDGCGGHLMVDSSGQKVTALSAAEQCTVNAQVGNFTDLKSNNFSITTRK